MLQGLIIAVLLTIAWVLIQVGIMHIRPTPNRLKAMTFGYLFSLPFVVPLYYKLPFPAWVPVAQSESLHLGLVQAFIFHLLLFLLYVECFYHIERSVTLRFMIEILVHPDNDPPLQVIQGDYSLDDMIVTRLKVLEQKGFVEQRDGQWHLRSKGRFFARAMQCSSWIFQNVSQRERM